MASFYEVNFDGLVAPNHNYAGLAPGNLASDLNRHRTAFPRQAALQGLKKMALLKKLGLKQAVVPPQTRPDFKALKKLGYSGNEKKIIDKLFQQDSKLLAQFYSASAMWVANCATISPSIDTKDGKVHITPANLISNFHRSIEANNSYQFLKFVFNDPHKFTVHPPLSEKFPDEGAANHCRLTTNHSKSGIELFVFGKGNDQPQATKFPARQNQNASKKIITNHKLSNKNSILAQQSIKAIDAGVFHNDVISTANENLFLFHEYTFENQKEIKKILTDSFKQLLEEELVMVEISERELKLEEAISTYLFNSQIVTLPDNSMTLIAPLECQENPATEKIISSLISKDLRLNKVIYTDLRQSMQNGGGPACLRWRAPLTANELNSIHQGILLDDKLELKLEKWIHKNYREELSPKDLGDYHLVDEIRTALDELTQILKLGSFYDFQKV